MTRHTFYALGAWLGVIAACTAFFIVASTAGREFAKQSEISASADQGVPRFSTGPNVLPPVITPENVWIANPSQSNTDTETK